MIALRQHSSNDYAVLPDIDLPGVGELTESDWKCLDEIGEGLVSLEAQNRFGATLLHSHFPVRSNETFVEELDLEHRQIRLRPIPWPEKAISAVNVRFEDRGEIDEVFLVGLEYAPDAALGPVAPISNADTQVLKVVRDILFRNQKIDRFGLRLFHNPLDMDDSELLAESCDAVERLLSCRVAKADDPGNARSIPTVFRWKKEEPDGLTTMQGCTRCTYRQICTTEYGGKHTSHDTHDQKYEHS